MRWPWKRRRDPEAEQQEREQAQEAALEKWHARARLDEQHRRWHEVHHAMDKFTADAERALRRQH